MLEIGDTVVSFDLFEHKFCCDLSVCRGCCCVKGDAGAPLTEEEVKELDKVLPAVRQFLSARALEVIDRQGTSYVDADGDNVTSLVDGRECVFTYFENGICLCALEKAYNEGLIDFPKPISCYLYPVRLEVYDTFTAVNVHRWECCRGAEICGKERGIPVYRYLKNSLIRRFGAEWYAELSSAAEAYYAEFKSVENKFLSK